MASQISIHPGHPAPRATVAGPTRARARFHATVAGLLCAAFVLTGCETPPSQPSQPTPRKRTPATARSPKLAQSNPPAPTAAAPVAPFPFALCFVPEMMPIPEVDDWSLEEHRSYERELREATLEWRRHAAWLERHVTPELVRNLSRWAQVQMNVYQRVPPLLPARFDVVAEHEGFPEIVLEATLDTLPTHQQLVTRWLKAYVIYDVNLHAILRVLVTIRGQRLE